MTGKNSALQVSEGSNTREDDSWLSAVFSAAVGPIIDMAFVDRILARIRRRQRIRSLVLVGTIIGAGALTAWQISKFATVTPSFSAAIAAPSWLTANPYTSLALMFVLAGLTAWMFTEEA